SPALVLRRRLGLHQRGAGIFLWKYTCQIAVLPLHADRVGGDVLAVRAEFNFSAGPHRRVSRRDVEGRESVVNFLRVGVRVMVPGCAPLRSYRKTAAVLVESGNADPAGAAVEGALKAGLL